MKSKTGHYTLDLSPSSKLVVGSQRIADLSNKDKNPDWSDLYRLIIPTSSSLSNAADNNPDDQDEDGNAIASSSMTRRTSSSDTLNSRKGSGITEDGNGDKLSTSPTQRRTPALRRNNSITGTAGRSTSASQSPFHSAARARIKRNRQELETKITQLRESFEAESRRYIEQADILASKLKAAAKINKRNTSPSALKAGAADKDATSRSDDSSHIVIRGGFDPPKTEARSPSQSYSSGLGSARTPITSPHLATAGNFPALFSSMSGATLASSSPAAGESVPSRDGKSDGIVQPTGPQSPTFRRSRSPSPSRDTSKGRNESKDRAGAGVANTAGSSTMERQTSDDQHTAATTSKRPALNLMRDVSNLEQEWQKKADNATEEATRGRSAAAPGTSLPAHSVLRKTGYTPNMSASYAPRQRGAWLRLNGNSPSPPANRLMLDRELPENDNKKSEQSMDKDVEQQEDVSEPNPRRASLSRHRHVSFKEPESGSSVEASPAPVEAPLDAEEEDEVPFDMDEDIQHLADEAEEDEEDGAFVAIEPAKETANGGDDAKGSPGTTKTREGAVGSVSKMSGSLSRSVDKKGQAAASLQALLNDPSSFIGSLKSRGYGAAASASSGTGQSPADFAISPSSSTAKDSVSLSDQAQRLRDLLALDAPSHRSTKSKRDKAIASYLRDETEGSDTGDIPDDELDSLAPVSALATSLPVAIGIPRFNKKEEYEFERKTSVPQRESMLVPPLHGSGRHKASKPGQYSPFDRLPSLGEESESAPGSRAPSPSGILGPVNNGIGDALAAGNDETDEIMDKLADLQTKEDFIPPHVSGK